MMKVLYTIDGLTGGGAETSLVEILPDLAARGVTLKIVTLMNDDNALGERVAAAGVEVRNLGALPRLGRLRALHAETAAWRPDVIHTSLLWSDTFGRMVGARAQVPIVTSLVNSIYGPEHRANSKYGAWSVRCVHGLEIAMSRMTTLFHAVSDQVKAVMAPRLHVAAERVEVVYRGRDAQRLGRRTDERRRRVRQALGIAAQAPVVLVVGRLDKQKAVDVSLAAADLVARRRPDLHILVAGRDGNALAELAQYRERSQIHFLGHRSDISDLMAAADVLSFPSRWEGLPGTLIEALALELPVAGSDIGPNREVLADVDWPLVAVDDAPALAGAIATVLEQPELSRERAARGRARFEATFTTNRAADGMVAVYRHARELHN